MIHELRTYTLLPKKAPEFLKLTRKVGFEIRSKHSKCLGYWTSEIGDLNQVVHLGSTRTRPSTRRAALSRTRRGRSVLNEARTSSSQESTILIRPTYAVRRARQRHIRLANTAFTRQGRRVGNLRKACPAHEELEARRGWSRSWRGLVYTCGGTHLQARADVRKQVAADPVWSDAVKSLAPLMLEMSAKILVPTSFSPMQ